MSEMKTMQKGKSDGNVLTTLACYGSSSEEDNNNGDDVNVKSDIVNDVCILCSSNNEVTNKIIKRHRSAANLIDAEAIGAC